MWKYFDRKDIPYNLRTNKLCQLPLTKTQRYGINSLSFRESLMWNTLDDRIKLAMKNFRTEIRSWDEIDERVLFTLNFNCIFVNS